MRAGVDVGGTFTDVVVAGERPRAVKVPTTTADQGAGVVAGLEAAGAAAARTVVHGTTTATNAVLERAVARTVLVTTEGFGDLLVIARQDRPSLYDLAVVRPLPLVPSELVVTVTERTGADGEAIVVLTDAEVERVAGAVAALAPESVAVSLLFSWAGAGHEERVCAALAARLGDGVHVTRSSVLLPELREYERTSTCVLNAAVAPVMRRYLSGLAGRLPAATVTVMTSGGGTASLAACAEAPVHTLLSGPAAGVVAAAATARTAGFADAVAFDMGGTSTDVCLIRDGLPDLASDAEIAGHPFRTPAVGIHTVGAGGGSIAWVDSGGALRVGPRSAGATPGPACYGLGGTAPTVTDAHCTRGHLASDRVLGDPAGGEEGRLHLDAGAAARALDGVPGGAAGVLTVVRATMARALRRVTTERGADPAGLALVAYGGAGPLHATALAREVGAAAVVVPPAPGVLSALGLLLAPPRHEASMTVMAPADQPLPWAVLEAQARAELSAQGATAAVTIAHAADCRYAGQAHELRVPADPGNPTANDLAAAFHAAHATAYGYALRDEPVVVVTVRVVATAAPLLAAPPADWDQGAARPERRRAIGVDDSEDLVEARVLDRAALAAGDTVSGPALIEQPDSTTLLLPGDRAEVDAVGNLVVRW